MPQLMTAFSTMPAEALLPSVGKLTDRIRDPVSDAPMTEIGASSPHAKPVPILTHRAGPRPSPGCGGRGLVGVGLLAAFLEACRERVCAVVADAQDHFACDGGDREVGVEVGEEGAAA